MEVKNKRNSKVHISVVALIIALISLTAKSQDINRFFPEKNLVTTGIYYYPEHWNEN